MSAANEILQPLSPSELHPIVIIATAQVEEYSHFQQAIKEAGFRCDILANPQEAIQLSSLHPGSVVFISWELANTDIKSFANQLHLQCASTSIIFAEQDNVQTRAEITSAGFSRTIQPPFSQKNFVMAVQKIVAERNEENEKRLRKINHHQRMQPPVEEAPPMVNNDDIYQQLNSNEDNSSQQFSHPPQNNEMQMHNGEGFIPSHQHHDGEAQDPHFAHFEAESNTTSSNIMSGEEFDSSHTHLKGEDLAEEEKVEDFMQMLSEESNEDEEVVEEKVEDFMQMLDEDEENCELDDFVEENSEGKEPALENWQNIASPQFPNAPENPLLQQMSAAAANNNHTHVQSEFIMTERDWFLLAIGSIVGLGLCFYLLAQVFIIPLL